MTTDPEKPQEGQGGWMGVRRSRMARRTDDPNEKVLVVTNYRSMRGGLGSDTPRYVSLLDIHAGRFNLVNKNPRAKE